MAMSSHMLRKAYQKGTSFSFRAFQPAALSRSYSDTTTIPSTQTIEAPYDAVIVGGGHNGLVAAAYLSKAGKKVAVFERRHVLGGAAVTEEIVPGFKFSRASYLLSLLRPVVFKDLELKRHGLNFYFRDPNSFTPIINSNESLLLGGDQNKNRKEIAKFSVKDAEVYGDYEEWLERLSYSLDPLLDYVPFNLSHINSSSWRDRVQVIRSMIPFGKMLSSLKTDLPSFYDLVMSPASKVLNRWFESDVLKATLATDAVIGALLSPYSVGSGYILLHHVMGEMDGVRNAWCYAEGGMGSVSAAIARSALSSGAHLFTEKPVKEVLVVDGKAKGILLEDGTQVEAKVVLSNATPRITFETLLPQGTLSESFQKILSSYDYTSTVTKINVALKGLPQFIASPAGYTPSSSSPGPHHRTTIHLNTESMDQLHESYVDVLQGNWSRKPLIEMCLPSALDPTLAPSGCHVASLFTQYTPYSPAGYTETSSSCWSSEGKEKYTQLVFDKIEEYAPGFKDLIIDWETLTPPDLERIFGLTGGNIFHGSLSLSQLYVNRPTSLNPSYTCPDVEGLLLCGSGAHPGGGVVGAAGRLAAQTAIKILRIER
ncbi:PREDICTED: pyridine nucleotide-disulfide oxidoreductase domain-containing protein 2-like isoform X1 [Amphimedon queenslandica]|uniref:Pyridine nucleotide-disulfide oxidoreductase domain-containing protein 2 n=2 Tax=Amphimedon queenslandica TaxID=400682 RepID=A0AAN0IXW0_AMPQE|nr:PREDICTED: pyridine nucleotide-disulfide oxidoreductase domain-containing protein 2-like isoform X1 [Amphimedon queenslandica]|eukprot:XP_019849387.1 PREDICTED: pyridine nucleotide-disulfide oxidoreductase domain-containing protein 2-like isoform X1 [Amphimedon queenslandica]